MKPDNIKLMYEFLRGNCPAIEDLKNIDVIIVFGRSDPLLAKKASEIYKIQPNSNIILTGGIGKDSGILAKLNIPEANFQAVLLSKLYNVPRNKIICETEAKNGGENCRKSINIILEKKLNHENIVIIAHATSARRLSELFSFESISKNFSSKNILVPTEYDFDSTNPLDQLEAAHEILTLTDWPAKNWLGPQNVPENLVEYAQQTIKKFTENR